MSVIYHRCVACDLEFHGHKNRKLCDECKKKGLSRCSRCHTYHAKLNNLRMPKYNTICDDCMIDVTRDYYTDENRHEWVECMICGVRLQDLSTHLIGFHNIRPREYKETYESPIKSDKLADRYRGENNPAYEHGGKYSPMSREFVGYKGLDDHEISKKMSAITEKVKETKDINNTNNTTIEYYIARGCTYVDAINALSDRQRTFTLEKCIEKHGEEKGREIWMDRQERWQATLNSKPDHVIADINRRKIYTHTGSRISKSEQELFDRIKVIINDIEQQYMIKRDDTRWYYYDIRYNNRLIEYNGDYWHANPIKYKDSSKVIYGRTVKEIWENDLHKADVAEKNGYEIMYIWESDFNDDKDTVIEKCISFLLGK